MIEEILSLPLHYTVIIIFIALSIASEIGYRSGLLFKRFWESGTKHSIDDNQTTIVNSSLGLLALFLGFTFSSALEHFETNRKTIVDEVAAITILYNYEKLMPEDNKTNLLKLTSAYVDKRLIDENLKTKKEIRNNEKESKEIQAQIISEVTGYIKNNPNSNISSNITSAIANVVQTEIQRTESLINSVPLGLFLPVGVFLIFNSFIMGISLSDGKRKHTVFSLGLYFLIALSVGIIIDLDKPFSGYILVDQEPITILKNEIDLSLKN